MNVPRETTIFLEDKMEDKIIERSNLKGEKGYFIGGGKWSQRREAGVKYSLKDGLKN